MSGRWDWIDLGSLLLLGLVGGSAAAAVGLPLPYMLGALVASAIWTVCWGAAGRAVRYPRPVRSFFVGCIGAMIGGRFTPDLPGVAAAMWPSFLAVLIFVVLAQAAGYSVLRWLGGYDRATATYAAMPGGLIEAVELGEKAGGDVRVLTVQHFARIVIVVVTVPLLFLWVGGESVGSSAGQTMDNGPSSVWDIVLIAALAMGGFWLGRWMHVPAAALIGPLLLCAALQGTGVIDLHPPGWLLTLAQLAVGAGLGTQFAGVSARMLARTFGFGVLVVALLLVLGAGMATGLHGLVPGTFETLFVSFAPGGMTEMALIALSLDASPVLVTAHHMLRIVFSVFAITALARWRGR